MQKMKSLGERATIVVEEIERKKMEVKEKVELQLGRSEEETRRLAQIWEELEAMANPMRKELANVRKKIDMANLAEALGTQLPEEGATFANHVQTLPFRF
ncbi:hypothetical protein M0R45_006224 [Rubus argutus]|uniref:RAB6-interacting golgin n=1 Tax=Rubus argutus TaxID=59490 RepID=A0AAW1YQF5_RUBAR